MIIEICGPRGGGKTTLMRKLMERQPMEMDLTERSKVRGYGGRLKSGQTLYVVGTYERVCGGAEGMTQDELRARISGAARRYDHVLFEGTTATTCFGTYAEWFKQHYPAQHCFAFLHPPYEVCAERVAARRAARGDSRPFKNGNDYFHSYVGNAIKRAAAMGAPHVVLDWKRPLPGLLQLLSERLKPVIQRRAA